jgi:hypothetical protein
MQFARHVRCTYAQPRANQAAQLLDPTIKVFLKLGGCRKLTPATDLNGMPPHTTVIPTIASCVSSAPLLQFKPHPSSTNALYTLCSTCPVELGLDS